MEKTILSNICNDINKLDIIEKKEIFINKYKDINEKIENIDKILNNECEDSKNNIDNKEKYFTDIIEELINLNMSEFNNNMTIEQLKYYSDLLKKYDNFLINEKNVIEYV